MTAVVLAGGPRDEIARLDPDAPNKAFVAIGGATLAARTVAALRGVDEIERIIAVAPPSSIASRELAGADEIRPDGTRIGESLASGLNGLAPDEPVLVVASDLAVLTAAAVDEFLAIARERDADVVYACVERAVHEARFPQFPHTWARLRDGTYCGGGCVRMRPRVLARLDAFLERLGRARKNPVALAGIFGFDVLLRFALGRLSIEAAERRASDLLHARVSAARCSHPEIAINIDRLSDVALAERLVVSGS